MQKEKNISTQEDQRTGEKTSRWQIRRREKPCLDDGRALCMRC